MVDGRVDVEAPPTLPTPSPPMSEAPIPDPRAAIDYSPRRYAGMGPAGARSSVIVSSVPDAGPPFSSNWR